MNNTTSTEQVPDPGAARIRLNRILCPVSFSTSARLVIDWATRLAAIGDSEVRLFHVLERCRPSSETDVDTSMGSFVDDERVLSRLISLANRLPGRARVSAAVTQGLVADEILRHAAIVRADAIAIGMRTRAGLVSPLVRHVAVAASCPVLVVPNVDEGQGGGDSRRIRQIVCAVDFSPASLAAADYAFALGRQVGGAVTVVHVLAEHWEGPERHDATLGDWRELIEQHFRQLLRSAVQEVSVSPRDSCEVVVSGWPCIEIVRLAQLQAADLIVMGIDGERDDERGAATACVLQFASCPVLLVPQRQSSGSRGRRTSRAAA